MKKPFAILFTLWLCTLSVLAQFQHTKFDVESITNVPSTILGGTTSNINYVIYTHGGGICLFPSYDSTNAASAGNMILAVQCAADRTLTNWNTVNLLNYTNTLSGTTDIVGRHVIPAADCGPVGAIRIFTLQCTDGATNNITVRRIGYSLRYPD